MNLWVREPWLLTVGYEQEFYRAGVRRDVRSIYLAIGFQRPVDWKL